MKLLKAYLASEQGVTAAEYGFLVGGIALAVLTVIFAIGDGVSSLFEAADGFLSNRIRLP